MKRFFLALALVLAVCGVAIAGVVPIPEPGVYWLFTGSGTIDGESFTSAGWWQITVGTNDARDYFIDSFSIEERRTFTSGRVEDNGSTRQGPMIYDYTEQGFSFWTGLSTTAFTMPDANTMTMVTTGTENPLNVATYTATRSTVEPTTFPPIDRTSSGGGGCSVGFSPLLVLLVLPLLLTRK